MHNVLRKSIKADLWRCLSLPCDTIAHGGLARTGGRQGDSAGGEVGADHWALGGERRSCLTLAGAHLRYLHREWAWPSGKH